MNRFELYRQTPADMAEAFYELMQGAINDPHYTASVTKAELEAWIMEEIDDQE